MQGQAYLYLTKVNTVYFSNLVSMKHYTEISEIGPARMARAAPGPQRKTILFLEFSLKVDLEK